MKRELIEDSMRRKHSKAILIFTRPWQILRNLEQRDQDDARERHRALDAHDSTQKAATSDWENVGWLAREVSDAGRRNGNDLRYFANLK